MKCSGVSCFGGGDADADVGGGETGGSATVVVPPQAVSANSRSGAVSAPARVGRLPIEALPPETVVDAGHKVASGTGGGASR
jgi:hypothetical protein